MRSKIQDIMHWLNEYSDEINVVIFALVVYGLAILAIIYFWKEILMLIKSYETPQIKVKLEKVNQAFKISFQKTGDNQSQMIKDFDTANAMFNNLIKLQNFYLRKEK